MSDYWQDEKGKIIEVGDKVKIRDYYRRDNGEIFTVIELFPPASLMNDEYGILALENGVHILATFTEKMEGNK